MSEGLLGDANLQRLLRARSAALKERDASDLREILATPGRRRWYRRLIYDQHWCRLQLPTYDPAIREGSAAHDHQNIIEGMRLIGLQLLTEAQTKVPDLWLRLIEEGIAQEQEDEAQRAEITTSNEE